MHPLTDAFIKGRAKFKKTTGKYFDNEKKPKAACHLGALYWGYTGSTNVEGPVLIKDFPELYGTNYVPVPCEDSLEQEGWVTSILIHLNDAHDGRSGWTDQNVAQWLEKALTSLR